MTISNQITTTYYVATASQTEFAYTFKVVAAGDITVLKDGVLQFINSDYTVSGVGEEAGGNVTFLTGVDVGVVVGLIRNVPITQETDYITNDSFSAEVHENALDKLTMIQQELKRDLSTRVLKLPVAAQLINIEFPASPTRAGKAVRWNSAGDGLEEIDITEGVNTSIVTAKGQIVRGSSAGVAEALAIGGDGQIIRAANGQIVWANEYSPSLTVTADAVITNAQQHIVILCDATTAAPELLVTLPLAEAANTGAIFLIQKIDTTSIPVRIITSTGTISGMTELHLRKQFQSATIVLIPTNSILLNKGTHRIQRSTTGVIANGDFADINQAASITDSTWSFWQTGAGWSIADGKATMDGGADSSLNQTAMASIGHIYKLTYTVTGRTAGTITAYIGTAAGTGRTTNSTFEENITSAGSGNIIFTGTGGFDGSVSDIHVRLVSTNATIPFDDTEPQNSEGARMFTLKHKGRLLGNKVDIEAIIYFAPAAAVTGVSAALFIDGFTSAKASGFISTSADKIRTITLKHTHTLTSLAALTYSVRIGTPTGLVYVDGDSSSRYHGITPKSTFSITEFSEV